MYMPAGARCYIRKPVLSGGRDSQPTWWHSGLGKEIIRSVVGSFGYWLASGLASLVDSAAMLLVSKFCRISLGRASKPGCDFFSSPSLVPLWAIYAPSHVKRPFWRSKGTWLLCLMPSRRLPTSCQGLVPHLSSRISSHNLFCSFAIGVVVLDFLSPLDLGSRLHSRHIEPALVCDIILDKQARSGGLPSESSSLLFFSFFFRFPKAVSRFGHFTSSECSPRGPLLLLHEFHQGCIYSTSFQSNLA